MNLEHHTIICRGHVIRKKDECYNCNVKASNTACENYEPIYVQKGYSVRMVAKELKQ